MELLPLEVVPEVTVDGIPTCVVELVDNELDPFELAQYDVVGHEDPYW